MKKIRALIGSILVVCMMLSLGISATAADVNSNAQIQANNTYVSSYANDLKNFVQNQKSANATTTTMPADKMVESFIAQSKDKYDFFKLHNSTSTETIKIDDNNSITIDKGLLYANCSGTVAATSDRIAKGAIDITSSKDTLAASSASTNAVTPAYGGTTPIFYQYISIYNSNNTVFLYKVYQEAQFTWVQGTSCTCNYANGYYTFGDVTSWSVQNWTNSATASQLINGVWRKIATSSGNFSLEITIQGIKVTISNNYTWARCCCNVYGNYYGEYGNS